MKEDYLWDKTGEPDPQIQHLERVMGQLRSERGAEALLPAFDRLPRKRPRTLPKVMLVAACLTFIALALGTFALVQRSANRPEAQDRPVAMVSPLPSQQEVAPSAATDKKQEGESAPVEVSVSKPKRSTAESRRRAMNRSLLVTVSERRQAEGLMAKERLLKALEITSSKLNVVQKKVQGAALAGPSS